MFKLNNLHTCLKSLTFIQNYSIDTSTTSEFSGPSFFYDLMMGLSMLKINKTIIVTYCCIAS